MKCFSYMQPWASLVILREKRNETRSRNYTVLAGRWHAVHASSTWTPGQRALLHQEPFRDRLAAHGITAGNAVHEIFPRGAIIGVAFVGWLAPSDSATSPITLTDQERAFGNYGPGRWIYGITQVFKLVRPILFTARLGVFDLPEPVAHQVLVGLQWQRDLPAELTSADLLQEAIDQEVARQALRQEVDQALDTLRGRQRDTRTPIERMIDKAVGRG